MIAVILAGGKGTRLRPYTVTMPKPLVPIGDKAILEILLGRLKKHGVTEAHICLGHFAEMIKAFIGKGDRFGMDIRYSVDVKPLSTIAPLKLLPELPENFLVMNGDLLTDLDFSHFFRNHLERRSLLTVATYRRRTRMDYGVIEVDPSSRTAIGFREKPEYDVEVSMGVYAMNRSVLDLVPQGKAFGFDDLMHALLREGKEIPVYPYDGYWLDIGRPDDFEKANTDFSTGMPWV